MGSAEQRLAIGAGLGIAASRCRQKYPDITLKLERLVRDSSDSVLQRSFAEKLKSNGVLSSEQAAIDRGKAYQGQLAKTMKPEEYRRTFNIREPGATGPILGIGAMPAVQPVPALR